MYSTSKHRNIDKYKDIQKNREKQRNIQTQTPGDSLREINSAAQFKEINHGCGDERITSSGGKLKERLR